jgi:hypothetical protein
MFLLVGRELLRARHPLSAFPAPTANVTPKTWRSFCQLLPFRQAATTIDARGVLMDLEVDRHDLHRMRAVDRVDVPLGPGEARLRIESFGLTANNVTYAVFGDAMGYWQFFPAAEEAGIAWGRVPVWGFAEVVESTVPSIPEATRLYGYLPMSSQVVVQPGRLDDRGFTDMAPHRHPLPSVYNRYFLVESDPIHRADREPVQMLLWPLFVTSFVVDDFLGDHGMFGATRVVISSASAKTAIGAAWLLVERPGIEVIGLTSPGNLEFMRSLDCYHQAITFQEVSSLAAGDTCFIDIAGRPDVTYAVHTHFGDRLRYSMAVGDTHWDHPPEPAEPRPGPQPTFLFAPDQITKRRRQWGPARFEQTVADAWNRFVPWTDGWMTLRHARGADQVESAFRSLVEGRVDPRVGDVCTLHGDPVR